MEKILSSSDRPKHIVLAYQDQLEDSIGNEIDDNSQSFIRREKSYPIGSLFSFSIQRSQLEIKKFDYSSVEDGDDGKENENDDFEYEDDDDECYDEKSRNPLTIEVPPFTRFSIDTIVVDPLTNAGRNTVMSLYVSTDASEYTCICPYLSSDLNNSHHHQSTARNLNITVIGPNTLQFALVSQSKDSKSDSHDFQLNYVNIYGKVEIVGERTATEVLDVKTNLFFDELKRLEDVEDALNDENEALDKEITNLEGGNSQPRSNTKNHKIKRKSGQSETKESGEKESVSDTNQQKKKKSIENGKEVKITKTDKKRKLNEDVLSAEEVDEDSLGRKTTTKAATAATAAASNGTVMPTQEVTKLSKKMRKKLAKKKAKELEEVISKQQGHNTKQSEGDLAKKTNSSFNGVKQEKISLTRQRSLSCGVLVRDIVHGSGNPIRIGRKVSINYIGKFADSGKQFDANTSKSNPLIFRLGTGEVIKGLDKGLEGMKVGGERIITIPPELGYGRKGSGNIPGNSTLCFEVKVLGVGNK